MLVLTRKHDEKIVISHNGKEIIITILKIQGSEKVSIGITAERETLIYREELLDRESPRGSQSHKKGRKRETPATQAASSQDLNRLVNAVHWSNNNEECSADKPAAEYFEEHSSYHP